MFPIIILVGYDKPAMVYNVESIPLNKSIKIIMTNATAENFAGVQAVFNNEFIDDIPF